jgi:hypothetical protein
MTATERDADEPAEAIEPRDELGYAFSKVFWHIFAELPDCPARAAALTATIQCHTRVAELLKTPRLN